MWSRDLFSFVTVLVLLPRSAPVVWPWHTIVRQWWSVVWCGSECGGKDLAGGPCLGCDIGNCSLQLALSPHAVVIATCVLENTSHVFVPGEALVMCGEQGNI